MNISQLNPFRGPVSVSDPQNTAPAPAAQRPAGNDRGLTITEAPVAGSEGVAEIADAALTRDDPLGKLMAQAFNLQPPSMPQFV